MKRRPASGEIRDAHFSRQAGSECSGEKAQQHEIDLIKTNLDVYKNILEKMIKSL